MDDLIRLPFPDAHTGTVGYWRSTQRAFGVRTWRSAFHRFALQHGRAVAMLADDSAIIATRNPETGKIREQTLHRSRVKWMIDHDHPEMAQRKRA